MSIQVLVGVMPPLLREIILSSLEKQADFHVTSAPADGHEWAAIASRTAPNVVITTASSDQSSIDFLAENPRTRILALKEDGRRAFLFELKPALVSLGELSPDGLIQAVRAAGEKRFQIEW
jgi:DNA-binding NarL/FixJ family response regulator